ncbi:arabinan endo-1,5-alpha-L-arabinosidase [Sphingomonas jatrophae]|uniref:Extracellular exo-alpha-(1->5)-L-arabinofuranosidase n=1 Tax=Sphingomonas jatrophae TaxID=1166337 RepID=A0A1I6JTS0_9SPHN|nr:arabinan endo-1,5-alpha-L-arabinosidase [Sphingomonas jatrophae]SFR82308.1 arabinan endo-1,5-alpha-L-arabinosidase [Sphingomonas jatrophae]
MRKALFAALGVVMAACVQAAPPGGSLNDRLTGDIAPTHDPVMIREGDTYYAFSTGLSAKTSTDLVTWKAAPKPLDKLPDWATKAVPGARDMWAPDISFVNGRYRLYYSVSTFGSNRSAIGLATSKTLDRASPNYGWRDEGLVVQSMPGDDYNAIDPNFVRDRDGRHWLALGSFWSGIKLFALDAKTGKPLDARHPVSLARRPAPAGGPAPVEAPFIIDRGGYYWLIVSYDYCCKGAQSTYYTVVGRSKAITGPYVGKDGSPLMNGQGTIFIRADLPEKQRWRGPGHAGVMRDKDGTDYVVWHAYDRENKGAPTLRIAPIRWGADGWPVLED